MKKRLLYLFLITVAGFSMATACKEKAVTIKGHVQFADPDFKIALVNYHGQTVDTLAVTTLDDQNNYSMEVDVDKPGVYSLTCHYWQSVSVWVEDEDMTVDFRGRDTAKIIIKNPPFVKIEGSPKNEIMNELNFNSYRNYQNMIAISQAAYKASFASEKDKSALSVELYDANYADTKARGMYLIDKYAGCTSVLAAIGMLDPLKDQELIDECIDKVLAAHPGYAPAEDMRSGIAAQREARLRMMPGQPAPEFSVPGLDGNEVGPATFKGKILLVDFWASWCGPCRGELPFLKKYYEEFKDKGVEFLSVSIDKSEDAWKKALEEENMAWPQALAPKAGADVMDLYQFSGIPFIVLIDADGKIVEKNLRGERTQEAISDLLNGIRPEDKLKSEPKSTAAPAIGGMMTPATPLKK